MLDRNDEPHYPIDAISLLKTDHRKVKNLFARYESAGNFCTKHLLAEQVFTELELHAQLEENVFYSKPCHHFLYSGGEFTRLYPVNRSPTRNYATKTKRRSRVRYKSALDLRGLMSVPYSRLKAPRM